MGTPCTIAVQYEDETVHMITCHWDGYLDGAGETLVNHYTDLKKCKELISLGDLSWLGNTTEHKPEFWDCKYKASEEEMENYRCTYADRKEKDVEADVFENIDDYFDKIDNSKCFDYHYLYMNSKWYLISSFTNDEQVEITSNLINDFKKRYSN